MKNKHRHIFGTILGILVFTILCCVGNCQVTSILGTTTDSDSIPWANAHFTVQFVPNASNPNIAVYNINGVSLTSPTYNTYINQTGVANNSGTLGVALLDNTQISPSGSSWKFTLQPNASVQATTYPNLVVQGSFMDISSFLSTNSVAPRFPAVLNSYGYSDVEISTTPNPGAVYWNVTSRAARQWNGTTWQSAGSGGGPPNPPNYSVQAYGPGAVLTSDPNIVINTTTHALSAPALNTIQAAGIGTNTNIQTTIANAASGRVFIPAATYAITAALNPFTSSVLDCAAAGSSSGSTSIAGSVIQPQSGSGANFALQSPSTTLFGLDIFNCGFDETQNTSGLGAISLSRISNSRLYNTHVELPTNGTQIGYSFNGATQSYWNNLIAAEASITGFAPNNNIALQFTNVANSNTVIGTSGSRIGTWLDLESGDSNTFIGGGSDAWTNYCIKLGPAAFLNNIYGARCETSATFTSGATNPTLLYMDAASYNNNVTGIYNFGNIIYNGIQVDDRSGQNSWQLQSTGGSVNNSYDIHSSRFQTTIFGINTTPYFKLGTTHAGLGVHGTFQTDGPLVNYASGAFTQWATPTSDLSTITGCSITSGIATFTSTNRYPPGAGVKVLITSGSAGFASLSGLYTVTSSAGSSWVGPSPGLSSFSGTCAGTSYILTHPVTNIVVASGVMTVTGLNDWQAADSVDLAVPTGGLLQLSGNYSVISSTGTTWTANTPTLTTTQFSCDGTNAVFYTSGNQYEPVAGQQINVVLPGFTSYNGVYTVGPWPVISGAWGASCSVNSGGLQTVSGGTAQLWNTSSTPVLATSNPPPQTIMWMDGNNNIYIYGGSGSPSLNLFNGIVNTGSLNSDNLSGGFTIGNTTPYFTLKLGNPSGTGTLTLSPVGLSSNDIFTFPDVTGQLALQIRGTLTATAAASDNASVTGATASSNCIFAPTNSTAAANIVGTYISAVTTNLVTITHPVTVTSGGTYNIHCTPN